MIDSTLAPGTLSWISEYLILTYYDYWDHEIQIQATQVSLSSCCYHRSHGAHRIQPGGQCIGFWTPFWPSFCPMTIFWNKFSVSNWMLFGDRVIVFCLFAIFGSHAQFTINERKKNALKMEQDAATRERFRRLFSPDLAEMVVNGQLAVEQGGENRNVAVMFVDIRNFTALSSKRKCIRYSSNAQ